MSLASLISDVKSVLKDRISLPLISLVANDDGHLSVGAVNVRVSALTEFGETLPCARVSLTVLANASVIITISRVPQARGYRIYASAGSAVETYQADLAPFTAFSGTYTLSTISSGAAMPTTDTGTIKLELEEYEASVQEAVQSYSQQFPYETNYEYTLANDTDTYELPEDWVEGRSFIRQVQYPAITYPPVYLNVPEEAFIKDGELCLRSMRPIDGQTLILHYSTPHRLSDTDGTDTIPLTHKAALTLWAAACACERLATGYADEQNSVVTAEGVSFDNRVRDFKKQAETHRKTAYQMLGLSESGTRAVSGVAHWNLYANHSEG